MDSLPFVCKLLLLFAHGHIQAALQMQHENQAALVKRWPCMQPTFDDGATHQERDVNSSIAQAESERPHPGSTPDVVFPENNGILGCDAVRMPCDDNGL